MIVFVVWCLVWVLVLIFSPISGSTVEASIATTREPTSPMDIANNNNNNNNPTDKMLMVNTGENGNETNDLANSTSTPVVVVNTENDHSNNSNNY